MKRSRKNTVNDTCFYVICIENPLLRGGALDCEAGGGGFYALLYNLNVLTTNTPPIPLKWGIGSWKK